jgi:hypothetical protein
MENGRKTAPRRSKADAKGLPIQPVNAVAAYDEKILIDMLQVSEEESSEKEAKVIQYFDKIEEQMNTNKILRFMQICALKWYKLPMENIANSFMKALRVRGKKKVVTEDEAVGTLYALHNLKSEKKAVRELVEEIALLIMWSTGDVLVFSETLGKAFYGLRGMNSKYSEVKSLLRALIPMVEDCCNDFTAETISYMLYGMQSMSSDHAETRGMIKVITSRLEFCDEAFSGQDVGFALYGLRNMRSNYQAVRDLLEALTERIEKSRDVMSPRALSASLRGMRNLNSGHAEVRRLLSVLTDKIRQTDEAFDGRMLSNALYGLENMSPEYEEVREILRALYEA